MSIFALLDTDAGDQDVSPELKQKHLTEQNSSN